MDGAGRAKGDEGGGAPSTRDERRWLGTLRRDGGWPLSLALALPLLSGLVLLGQAALLAALLHAAIADGRPLEALVPDLALLAALLGLRALLSYLGERAAVAGAERVKRVVRERLFAALLEQRPHWTAQRASGALAGALCEQVEALDGFFARFLPAMVAAAVLPPAFALLVLPLDWAVGLLFLVTAPLVPLFMALVGWGAEAAGKAQALALSRLSARFADRLRGLSTLLAFGRAQAEADEMGRIGEEWRARTMGVLRIAFLSSAVLEFFAALGVAGVALYVGLTFLGLVDLHAGTLTLETGLFCLLMAPEVYAPLRQLAAHYHDRAGAMAAAGEIAAAFGALPPSSPAAEAPAGASTPAQGALGVAVGGLRLSTPCGTRRLLDGADLTIRPGLRVALLGPSGCGKTTLLETLARLREADGTVRLGAVPLSEIAEAAFRERVAFVGQRPRLFHGTIADNIRLGRPQAGAAALRRAAELAEVDAFADLLPGGLDAPVGDGGLGLSGGEAQRVALARLYLRDPGLILLDEPTAHLDRATQERVLDKLLTFADGRTLLLATHSPAVAARMDLVLTLEGGRLVAAPPVGGLRRFALCEDAA
ncbi:thiol reductant ABC exporter subunit CydD [Aurantimonas sp. Leaf443]|uniref:thiol reductant ABC exporter subunit CydD n=1 Tax=Aurantimonas sp. Leaf443 TaxID=1736378 RepID=UPI0007008C9B|nr:thiol reductant ABC exporter subunit CydD [Aurantimonas sp. Leaf443]KQT84046.1 ABC transporter ATP-binding protein [Aurantimonas sp. Leaf443]